MKIQISLSKVPLSKVRTYMSGFNRQRYANIFNKYGSNGGNGKSNRADKFRIYIPINGVGQLKPDTLVAPKEVVEHLASKGMSVNDYRSGTALLPDGKRIVRIGKVLSDQQVKKIYDQDPQRSATKSVPAWVVISRHPYDIIGMSFDRGWTSCMNLEDGNYKSHLKYEIKQGSLVAYLVKATDKNINNPISRIALKPYLRGNNRVLVPSVIYGTYSHDFTKIVQTFCQWANSGSPIGTYTLASGCYNDLELDTVLHAPQDIDMTKLSSYERLSLADSPITTPEHLVLLSTDLVFEVRQAVAMNSNTPTEVLTQLAQTKNRFMKRSVAENVNTSAELLDLFSKVSDKYIRAGVAQNKKSSSDILTRLATDKDVFVRDMVADNPKAPDVALLLLAKDKYYIVRHSVALRQNLSSKVLSLLATDKSPPIKRHVAENPNTPAEALTLLAKDENPTIISYVVLHPNTPAEALTLLAKNADASIRQSVAKNPNTPAEALTLLAKDKNLSVRTDAKKNPSFIDQ